MSETQREAEGDVRREIHVVIATRTLVPIVAEILWVAIVDQPDMTLRATDLGPEALESGDAMEGADVLVIGSEVGGETGAQHRLAYAHPRTGILAISADAHEAELVVLRPQVTRLELIAPQEILAAIRLSAGETTTRPG